MALHDELAELRAEVGPHVFDDPTTFRAAFDDFVAEGSATTGEVSLLVGAVATGAIQRLREQLGVGADPADSIAAQGDLLARDRGTSESSGARWAVSVLAYAVGAVPAELVLPRPPVHDSVSPPDAVSGATASRPGPVMETKTVTDDDAMPQPPGSPDATRVVGQDPTQGTALLPATPTPPEGSTARRGNPLLLGALAAATVVVIVLVALLVLGRDGDADGDRDADGGPVPSGSPGSTTGSAPATEEVLDRITMTQRGKTVEVRLVRDGTDAFLVLLTDTDGGLVEVDRKPVTCPYGETAYDAGLEDQGDNQIFWGWAVESSGSGYGEYGEVDIDDEVVTVYGMDEADCPE